MSSSRIEPGNGRVVLHNGGSGDAFSELAASYPLKVLSPQLSGLDVSIVYVLTYGGGLVGGDRTQLDVEVHDGTRLCLLSQGYTKVFKARPDQRRSARAQTNSTTTQRLDVKVMPHSALFLLPDPVTCFRAAEYHQIQTFHLSEGSSLVLLDWITSGRKSLGEEWVFKKYYSLNDIWVCGNRIAKDAMLLEERDSPSALNPRSLAESLAPYSCYATVIMYGPLVQDVIQHLSTAYATITVYRQSAPPSLLWSLSPICDGQGCVVRVAGKETEDVKHWLGEYLRDLQQVLGIDVYRRAFA